MKFPDQPPEPWMTEFVKGRHSQEEWDWFFTYVEAGPIRRFFMVFAQILFQLYS